MDMIQVDPKLFVTCRLCLEDLGQYQIVPTVKQQIKYCFDIDVEPFDGLPQLLCMKCKEILHQFHSIKTTFNEKQTKLLNKVLTKDDICIEPQQDTVSSSQQVSENTTDNSKKKKPKRNRVLQSSSSDLESEQSFHVSKPKKKKLSRRSTQSMPWEADYKKQFICRICNSIWFTKRSIWNHIRSHDIIKATYDYILKRQSFVNLNKIDNEPNLTGVDNMVVYSRNKIIAPGSSYFYTVYSKATDNVTDTHNLENTEPVSQQCIKENSSDDEEEIVLKATKRKRRILSRSSSETVVIASNNNILSDFEEDSKLSTHDNIDEKLGNDHQCINIEDSSDSESGQGKSESSQITRPPMEAKLGDYKIIQGIISMCVNSYNKNNDTDEVDILYANASDSKNKDTDQLNSESQLKHKVLSIGRKVINKQGFNCTGLLRYMEKKNLEIMWLSKGQSSCSNKELNYIRILTKLRGSGSKDDNLGFEDVSSKPEPKTALSDLPAVAGPSHFLVKGQNNNQPVYETTCPPTDIKTSHLEQINNHLNSSEKMATMLYLDRKVSSTDMKKLLNANPVANPKQLPKKVGPVNETRSNKITSQPSACRTVDEGVTYCMPIITSTTSLAAGPTNELEQVDKQNPDTSTTTGTSITTTSTTITTTNTTSITTSTTGTTTTNFTSTIRVTSAPRIKVKPVSELMPEKKVNNFMMAQSTSVSNNNMLANQIENIWPHQNTAFIPNIASQLHITSPPLQIVQMCPNVNITPAYQVMPTPTTTNVRQNYVILHTTEFPNTKTTSPFKYLKDLLQVHNLVLLDSCETLSQEFICLIRFKVQLTQESNRNRPVIFCLSIFCLRNTFCLQVRHTNQEAFDLNSMCANWQWEILRTYRGDVVYKVLQNAQRISQAIYECTNKFVCLLKSIERIKE